MVTHGHPAIGEPVTLDQVKELRHGETLYLRTKRDSRGKPSQIRISGAVKTWKTRPGDVRVPYKYGLYESGYVGTSADSDLTLDQVTLDPFCDSCDGTIPAGQGWMSGGGFTLCPSCAAKAQAEPEEEA